MVDEVDDFASARSVLFLVLPMYFIMLADLSSTSNLLAINESIFIGGVQSPLP